MTTLGYRTSPVLGIAQYSLALAARLRAIRAVFVIFMLSGPSIAYGAALLARRSSGSVSSAEVLNFCLSRGSIFVPMVGLMAVMLGARLANGGALQLLVSLYPRKNVAVALISISGVGGALLALTGVGLGVIGIGAFDTQILTGGLGARTLLLIGRLVIVGFTVALLGMCLALSLRSGLAAASWWLAYALFLEPMIHGFIAVSAPNAILSSAWMPLRAMENFVSWNSASSELSGVLSSAEILSSVLVCISLMLGAVLTSYRLVFVSDYA